MFTFQSLYRNLDIQLPGGRVVELRNFTFTTNDEAVAAQLRKQTNRNFWENSASEEEPKKRGPGRPRTVVQGVRASTVAEGDKEEEA